MTEAVRRSKNTKIQPEPATIGGELSSIAAQGEISTPPRSRTSSPWWGGSSPPLDYGFVVVAWCISLLFFIVLDPHELPIMIVDIFVILFCGGSLFYELIFEIWIIFCLLCMSRCICWSHLEVLVLIPLVWMDLYGRCVYYMEQHGGNDWIVTENSRSTLVFTFLLLPH